MQIVQGSKTLHMQGSHQVSNVKLVSIRYQLDTNFILKKIPLDTMAGQIRYQILKISQNIRITV